MITLEAGEARAEVSPADGGRVASLTVGGQDLLVRRGTGLTGGTTPEALLWGCFPMAPWPGRLARGVLTWRGEVHRFPRTMAPHAIHGTTWSVPWDDRGHDRTSAVMHVELTPPWPFGGHVVHRVRLTPDALHLDLEVHAHDRAMPAGCGWHPWFPRHLPETSAPAPAPGAEDARLSFSPAAMWERGADGIPTGRLVPVPPGPWDDCFDGVAGDPALTWPGGRTLTISSPCPAWVVFDQPAEALCVEPQTLRPDGLASAPVLEPGGVARATCTMRWSGG